MNYFIYKDLTVSPVQTLFYKNNIKNILIVIIDIAATKALWVVARTQRSVWFLTNNLQYLYDTLFHRYGSAQVYAIFLLFHHPQGTIKPVAVLNKPHNLRYP